MTYWEFFVVSTVGRYPCSLGNRESLYLGDAIEAAQTLFSLLPTGFNLAGTLGISLILILFYSSFPHARNVLPADAHINYGAVARAILLAKAPRPTCL